MESMGLSLWVPHTSTLFTCEPKCVVPRTGFLSAIDTGVMNMVYFCRSEEGYISSEEPLGRL